MTITHFSNGQIFDGETPDLKTDCYVEVSDNKITYIGKEKPESRCDQAFDLKGSTIMGNGQWGSGALCKVLNIPESVLTRCLLI